MSETYDYVEGHGKTMKRNVDVLVFAGGTGARMSGASVPKQFLMLGGKPIIMYTLSHFASHPYISGITVACVPDWIDSLQRLVENANISVPVYVIPGGATGQQSRLNGINYIHSLHPSDESAIVLVHDGVRPLIDQDTITACVDSVSSRGCTVTVAPVTETIVMMGEDDTVKTLVERDVCRLARAPQGFITNDLWSCYNKAASEKLEFIDSATLMAHYGYPIHAVDGPADNIKVTTPADYFAFKGYMDMRDFQQLWGK